MQSDLLTKLSDHYELPYEEVEKKANGVLEIFYEAAELGNQQMAEDYITNAGLVDKDPLLFFQLAFQIVANISEIE